MHEKIHDEHFRRNVSKPPEREKGKGTNFDSRNCERNNSGIFRKRKLTLDYIAGFFDGEGSVSLQIHRLPSTVFGIQFLPHIAISQKTRDILTQIQKFLGFGKVRKAKDRGQCYFEFHRKSHCLLFIELMKDRIRLKRQQLLLLKKAIRILRKPEGFAGVNKDTPYTKDEVLALLDIVEKIRELNGNKQRGTDIESLRISIIDFNKKNYLERLAEAKKRQIEALNRYRNIKTHAFWKALLSALKSGPERYKNLQTAAKKAGFSETSVKRILHSLKLQHLVSQKGKYEPYQITEDGIAWLERADAEAVSS